jgi:hypothetical protein
MKYKCSCGNISKITFSGFQQGSRCKKCAIKNNSGENNYNWNPNLTDKEREENKNRARDSMVIKWRIMVFIRDNYTCKKCGKHGCELNAHHIICWIDNKKLRYIVSNGITFCKYCHKEFHHIYGYKNNNQEQLNEFMKQEIYNYV